MKKHIHPKYMEAEIICGSCGNVIRTRSTKPRMVIEVCSNCHPFYKGTQEQLIIDVEGRVEQFRRKYGLKEGESTTKVIRGARKKGEKEGK
ncbi:MAG TPA: 50S ribosomal protein L31 [Armatimonadetes bacterium]|nr:50S ribosomal protein L31 [Armatimonadota bacterium]